MIIIRIKTLTNNYTHVPGLTVLYRHGDEFVYCRSFMVQLIVYMIVSPSNLSHKDTLYSVGILGDIIFVKS